MKYDGICGPTSFESLGTEIWREACRHIEISQSTETIAALLTRRLPLEQIIVRRIDVARSCLETVAVGLVDPDHPLQGGRKTCSPTDMVRLLAWCGESLIAHRDCGPPDPVLEILVPPETKGDVLAGLLGSADQPLGVLIVVAPEGCVFEAAHEEMLRMLLEPFSTALENDHRLREMDALRAAAEADKRSLLNRLGRKDLADTVVGADSGLRPVMERVQLVARSDVPVLILGETGTGKEVIARMIHTHSARASGPFLRVNCGAIPMELIDSQLFGHERGAFTGAVDSRQGWFERSDGGTLLLDEVGELPPAAQVRLLRILQDGWLERVGGQRPINVDVRIVAATHRDLATMVAEGTFRQDLWYRIAVFPIHLPPLRQRPEDIPALARHFAERAASRFVLPVVTPTAEDVELLLTYPWPGNIRELAAVIDRAAILGDGRRLEVAKALGISQGQGGMAVAATASTATKPTDAAGVFLSLDEAAKQHIESALALTRGRIEGRRGAASLLKINPHTLRARMRKLGVDWTQYRDDD